MSVLIFLLILFVLVLVHEWGHYITAKKTGMRVDEFAIGFPPKLFGWKRGETDFNFNLLPIGGYVKIWGENLEEIPKDHPDYSRSFAARPKWAQAVVLVAGVTMNIVLAWFLFLIVTILQPVQVVDESVAGPEAALYVNGVLPDSPASGVLPPGAEILSIESATQKKDSPKPSEVTTVVASAGSSPVSVTYEKDGSTQTVSVTPQAGLFADDSSRLGIGVSLALTEEKNLTILGTISDATSATYNGFVNVTVGLFTLLKGAFTGTADFSQIAGPVGIVGLVGDAASVGITALLIFTAVISLNLAVINLLPVPALDGGRLLFVVIEAVTCKPIKAIWAGRLNLIGFVLLMLLMVVVTYNDIIRILN